MIVIRSAPLRKTLRFAVPFALIPAVIAAGALLPAERRYAAVSLAVTVLALLLFAAGFESERIGSRRLILASVMTALAVAGRFIPVLKPVAALTALSGMYLGGEAGFLVGAMTAVLSDFSFGQGPWTPFQMFAWGMVGFAAGFLAAPLKKSRPLLLVFGALSGVWYSMFMDLWTVLSYSGTWSGALYLAAVGTAVPETVQYAVSNVLFLQLFAGPFGEKLERIRVKYGV
jgi:energy-coupling factor transport system substrate-specific component